MSHAEQEWNRRRYLLSPITNACIVAGVLRNAWRSGVSNGVLQHPWMRCRSTTSLLRVGNVEKCYSSLQCLLPALTDGL